MGTALTGTVKVPPSPVVSRHSPARVGTQVSSRREGTTAPTGGGCRHVVASSRLASKPLVTACQGTRQGCPTTHAMTGCTAGASQSIASTMKVTNSSLSGRRGSRGSYAAITSRRTRVVLAVTSGPSMPSTSTSPCTSNLAASSPLVAGQLVPLVTGCSASHLVTWARRDPSRSSAPAPGKEPSHNTAEAASTRSPNWSGEASTTTRSASADAGRESDTVTWKRSVAESIRADGLSEPSGDTTCARSAAGRGDSLYQAETTPLVVGSAADTWRTPGPGSVSSWENLALPPRLRATSRSANGSGTVIPSG